MIKRSYQLQIYLFISLSLFLVACTTPTNSLVNGTNKILVAQTYQEQRTALSSIGSVASVAASLTQVEPLSLLAYENQAERLAFQYPENWALDQEEEVGFHVVLLTPYPELVDQSDPDFREPFAFLIAGVRPLAASEAQTSPLDLQAQFVSEFELDFVPLGDLVTTEDQDGIYISQDFIATDRDQAELAITITTMVNGAHTVTFLYGGNTPGLDEHSPALIAIAQSVRLIGEAQPQETAPASETQALDFSDPASVVEAIFVAAATEDFERLAGLCDPLGQNDGDTATLCEIDANHEAVDQFIEYFATGRVSGPVIIDDDEAAVPFLFGPDGQEDETMNLINRDGKWYLSSF